ncbi:EXS family-domain-containing protein [Pseudomassariella vexata]|uniref:EXS family-domain-containing protein n=1 Tax=Pseudomassariella vexata TaxID=1141098 RepID=A0A1Y2E3H2_9PEZI|nr:EXS family-domain-containing protein [Pseudomassariella vexata]ORY65987.1 EXS family-domain-containing protein [Pseudomassariella vexata]
MDGDPAVESELDSFSLNFPLPYRVAFIVVLAAWGWGANLHYLYSLKIDVPTLIRYPGRTSPHQPPHHLSTYRLATVLSTVYAFSLVIFWIFTHRNPALVLAWDWLPLTYLVALLALFLFPFKNLSTTGRSRFLHTLKRVSIGGIAEAKDGKFGDILLADVLTSYAKVFGDLYVALCMFCSTNGSATARPDRNCGGTVIVPLIMATPSLIRLRQCLIEYGRVRRAPSKESGWGGQHLANALKYSTAFPVIIFSTLQRNWSPSAGMYRAWVVACMVNSFYSFYWDVTKDWDLTLFSSSRERNAHDHPFGLRRILYIGPPAIYYGVIMLDLLLRFTWSLKLSPHLDHLTDFESSIFVIEFLEVFRRWVWIFFRIETEWIRNQNMGLGVDDILLGDYYRDEEDD